MSASRTSFSVPARPASKVTIEKVKPVGDLYHHERPHQKQLWKIWVFLLVVLFVIFLFVGPNCSGAQPSVLGDNLPGACNNNVGMAFIWALVISAAVTGVIGVCRY